MELVQRDIGTVTVLDLSGRLTLNDGSGLLRTAVTDLVSRGRTNIVLNLARLSYLDSAGLGEMVACYSSAAKAGGAVKLTHATDKINDLLSITKLLTVFDTFDAEPEALASFGHVA